MEKRAELTTQQLVTIIILIVSFSVILFFIFRLNLGGETTNKEICHNSVLLKTKQSIGGVLDCRTSYICISGGEKCEDFSSKQEIVKIDLGGSPDEIKTQTMKAIADEMADCWWMFGEGKVDYSPYSLKDPSTLAFLHCGVCSSLKFDKNLQNKLDEGVSYGEFYNYILNTKKDDSQVYLKYIYGINTIGDFDKLKKNEKIKFEFPDKIGLGERYSVIVGSNPDVGDNNDQHIHPYVLKSNEISVITPCEYFDITKA